MYVCMLCIQIDAVTCILTPWIHKHSLNCCETTDYDRHTPQERKPTRSPWLSVAVLEPKGSGLHHNAAVEELQGDYRLPPELFLRPVPNLYGSYNCCVFVCVCVCVYSGGGGCNETLHQSQPLQGLLAT